MSGQTPPARVEFLLVYACPACGRELQLPAQEAESPMACRHCGQNFRPQPLAPRACEAMRIAFAAHQPPVPQPVRVVGQRGVCFSLVGPLELLRCATVMDLDDLQARLAAGDRSPEHGIPVLAHGLVREFSTPGEYAFAILEVSGCQTGVFLEFPDPLPVPAWIRAGSCICVQGTCRGSLSRHAAPGILLDACILLGAQGRLLPPGGQVAEAVFDLPPGTTANPLGTHLIFQSGSPG